MTTLPFLVSRLRWLPGLVLLAAPVACRGGDRAGHVAGAPLATAASETTDATEAAEATDAAETAATPAAPATSVLDAAARVDFTVDGRGHQHEQVHIRDVYPEESRPAARFYHDGIAFGESSPLFEIRAGKLGPALWAIHLLVAGTGTGAMRVETAQPALIYNGDNTSRQQSWFAQIVLPPLRHGSLTVSVLPGGPAGRVRGTFAGTLVDDEGNELTVSSGTFDLARLPDVE